MFKMNALDSNDKPSFYAGLLSQAEALMHGEQDYIANAANFSALLFHSLSDVNWLGFYFLRETELVVGPFQGLPACIRIAPGRGVCGTSFSEQRSIRVADVDAFPGHIPCDAASRSELVVPIWRDGKVFGVLDIDSPIPDRFDAEDQAGIEALAAAFSETLRL